MLYLDRVVVAHVLGEFCKFLETTIALCLASSDSECLSILAFTSPPWTEFIEEGSEVNIRRHRVRARGR
jgi:hypothetical protein